jgi:alpha-1,3-rhamnosyl/mannosyltransferase
VAIKLALDARKLTDFGIGTYIAHLLSGLSGRPEYDLTVIIRPEHERRIEALAPNAEPLSVSARGYGAAEQVKVPAVLWRERPDLVHIPHFVVPLLSPGPVVVTVHDVIPLFYPPRDRPQLATMYLRFMLRSVLRRARRVMTVSRNSRRDLVALFGADERRIDVVPNGVEDGLGERPPAADLDQVKAEHGLRPPLILVVANDKPHKNLDGVLRAFELACRKRKIPGQLVLVGGGGESHRLIRRAERLGIADRVRIVGRVSHDRLRALYHLSAVLLHLALYEGFGLPVLEAMRVGLPVVTSNLGAMRELGEGSARLVNPLDLAEVAETLEQVLVDDSLRRRMVEAGLRRAEKLTWERTVEGTVESYRKALGEK